MLMFLMSLSMLRFREDRVFVGVFARLELRGDLKGRELERCLLGEGEA